MKTAIDLFCGSGAVTWGLKNSGFQVIGAVDCDPVSCATYRLNHPEVYLIEKDIKKVNTKQIKKFIINDLDLIAVCAPCQPFSNRNQRRQIKDKRVSLVLESLRFIEEFRPRMVFFENVPGIGSSKVFEILANKLHSLGFFLGEPHLVDAAQFGVPQRRQRMVLVGAVTKKMLHEFKIPTLKKTTISDAIGDLPIPPVGSSADSGDPLHHARRHSQLNIERLKHIPVDGGSRDALPENLQLACHKKLDSKKNTFSDSYGRLKWKDLAPTLTTGCTDITKGRYAHPSQNRAITLREAARIQSFPDCYTFSGGCNQIAVQIGNAVPPKMMKEIGTVINKALCVQVEMKDRPKASSPQVSKNMKKVRVRDTAEEMAVRRILFTKGLRYRVQYQPKNLKIGRSSIDIAFPGRKVAVFIDGCFWHGCPEHGSIPKENNKWWANKILENQASDVRVASKLTKGGWTVLRFWAHEDPEFIVKSILRAF